MPCSPRTAKRRGGDGTTSMKKAVLSNIVTASREALPGQWAASADPTNVSPQTPISGSTVGNASQQPSAPFTNDALPIETSLSPRDEATKSPVRIRLTSPLSAVAGCVDMDWAVVAGREVLKILSVYDDDVKEVLNLRGGVKLSLNFSINDVKWGNSFAKSTIATAATNGAVVIWDLNRPNVHKLERILTEHTRAVNRINFHPTEPGLLLSASQDGSMRLWDLRAKSIARNAFEGKSESVRDVQFCPSNPWEFVAAFENGTIQKWDVRFPAMYERKWNAHNGLALTVDWHPDGRLVASGGRDRLIKVWDTKSESRLPLYTIQTIAPVARVSWRPGHDHQLASCALSTDHAVHLWDLGRPYIASYTLDAHEGSTTGFLWRDSNTIWSCSKDRSFARHDIRSGYRPLERRSTCAMGWNVDGELTFAIDERRKPFSHAGPDDGIPAGELRPLPTTASYYPLRRALRKAAGRPAGDDKIPQYKPRQRAGTADTDTFDVHAFIAFAENLSIDSKDIWTSCETNSQLASDLGLHRTAQTWRILQLLYSTPKPEPRNLTLLYAGPGGSLAHMLLPDKLTGMNPLDALFAPLDPQDGLSVPQGATGRSATHSDITPGFNNMTVGSAHSDSALLDEHATVRSDGWLGAYAAQHRDALPVLHHSDLDLDNTDIERAVSAASTRAHHPRRRDRAQSSARYPPFSGPGLVGDNDDDEGENEDEGANGMSSDDSDVDTTASSDSESSFTYGLKVGAGRRTLARFGIGTRTNGNTASANANVNSPPPPTTAASRPLRRPSYGQSRTLKRRSAVIPPPMPVHNLSDDPSAAYEHPKRHHHHHHHHHHSHHTSAAPSRASGRATPARDVIVPAWNHEQIVKDALVYYAEQGNVQMCVTVLLVLRDKLKIDEKTEEMWFWSYVDLLHRFKLWTPATAVTRAGRVASVRARNQESTTIHTICNQCQKPMLAAAGPNWGCENCGALVNPCSFWYVSSRSP
ncbi:WD repeat-containing protein 24 [Thoreauomyces humboldtii]|nr:WD repeat-containing protein 24 [Thoreauomyces humboldtii]